MDLFNPIKFVFGDDPYADRDMGAFYPAICYAFYKLLSFIYPEKYHAEDVTAFNLRDASYGTFYIISGTVLFVAALVLLFVYKLRGKNIFYIVAVVYSVLYASPILFLWERANSFGTFSGVSFGFSLAAKIRKTRLSANCPISVWLCPQRLRFIRLCSE